MIKTIFFCSFCRGKIHFDLMIQSIFHHQFADGDDAFYLYIKIWWFIWIFFLCLVQKSIINWFNNDRCVWISRERKRQNPFYSFKHLFFCGTVLKKTAWLHNRQQTKQKWKHNVAVLLFKHHRVRLMYQWYDEMNLNFQFVFENFDFTAFFFLIYQSDTFAKKQKKNYQSLSIDICVCVCLRVSIAFFYGKKTRQFSNETFNWNTKKNKMKIGIHTIQ